MKSIDGKKYCSYNVGSPIYMPPEALNENKYSFKSDIWALGVIFYEMLTGKTPWKAKTEKETKEEPTDAFAFLDEPQPTKEESKVKDKSDYPPELKNISNDGIFDDII